MILPFSSSRSRTSLISKALYCASFTPRAMFSKSMNSASFRSPFIPSCPFSRRSGLARARHLHDYTARLRPARKASGRRCIVERDGEAALRALEVTEVTDEAGRSRTRRTSPAGTDADGQVAGPHVRPHAAVRSCPLDVPLLRSGRARRDLDVAGVPEVAAGDGDV